MNASIWCDNALKNTDSQKYLEEKLQALLMGPLRDKSDYAKEKALKSFSEGIGYLESLLMYQSGIHHTQINPLMNLHKKEEMKKKYLEVENTVKKEINRQYKHFCTFL